jgi:putative ABC transport system substrate-binding protein
MGLLNEGASGSVTRRRVLIAAFAGCLPALPGWAQGRPGAQVVGFLAAGESVGEIVRLLGELGYVEGRNLRVDSVGTPNLRALPRAAMQLISRQPDVLVAGGPALVALAAFTKTIPIVCEGVPDPVGAGLAQSLARPGGNVTGLATDSPETAAITFGLLKQVRPGLQRIAMLHAGGVAVQVQMRSQGEAAKAAGLEWTSAPVNSIEDAERVLPPLAGQAVWLASLGHPRLWRPTIELAHKHRIATVGAYPGALMSYSRVFSDAPRRVAAIVDQILKGANPAQIPFEGPDREVFTVNRTTARAIGVEFPPGVLLRATEVVD